MELIANGTVDLFFFSSSFASIHSFRCEYDSKTQQSNKIIRFATWDRYHADAVGGVISQDTAADDRSAIAFGIPGAAFFFFFPRDDQKPILDTCSFFFFHFLYHKVFSFFKRIE